MNFNVICGLPRSGSTLLCNLLNQNPEVYAGSTSGLCQTLSVISHTLSTCSEFQSELIRDRELAEGRMYRAMRGFVEQWYSHHPNQIIFDKGRGWAMNSQVLQYLFPQATILAMVRDPREVFASMEKQNAKNPLLSLANTGQDKTLFARADTALSPGGIIGSCVVGVEDLLRRHPQRTLFIEYRALCENPAAVMERIYLKLGMPNYPHHDFQNVINTSEDVDGLYLYKFPHEGSGEVKKPDSPDAWKQYIPEDLGQLIITRYPYYAKTFEYVDIGQVGSGL